jgi:hypothetical protein
MFNVIDAELNMVPKKYKGEALSDIIRKDPEYIWWLKSQDWAVEDENFIEQVKDMKEPPMKLWFGKHKNETLDYVAAVDRGYLEFLKYKTNMDSDSKLYRAISRYI